MQYAPRLTLRQPVHWSRAGPAGKRLRASRCRGGPGAPEARAPLVLGHGAWVMGQLWAGTARQLFPLLPLPKSCSTEARGSLSSREAARGAEGSAWVPGTASPLREAFLLLPLARGCAAADSSGDGERWRCHFPSCRGGGRGRDGATLRAGQGDRGAGRRTLEKTPWAFCADAVRVKGGGTRCTPTAPPHCPSRVPVCSRSGST